MAGSTIDEELAAALPSNGVRTVALVGRTGNGRSATGNNILGRKAFKSRASSSGVASACELQQTVMEDGQIINVIDTPGLFDFAGGSEFVGKEIVKCIEMAKDGIHAFLVVFSVRSRFSQEEAAALHSLQTLFGDKIIRYMIIVFTGGDELEENDKTLEDYLGRECPQPLKELLTLCGNRRIFFNNKTKDELERVKKVQELLSLVDTVIAQNGGRPYSVEQTIVSCLISFSIRSCLIVLLFSEHEGAMKLRGKQKEVESLRGYAKRKISEFKVQIEKLYEEQLQRITEMLESKIRETTTRLEKQLAEEQSARLKAEEVAQLVQMRSNDEIRKLHENLERARKEAEEQFARLKAEEQSARLKAEEVAQLAQMRSNDEIRKLRDNLERTQKEAEEQSARLKAEEQSARLKAEEVAQLAQMRLNDEICELRENLETTQKEAEEQYARLKAEEQSARLKAEEVAQLAKMRLNDEICELRENLERTQKEAEDQSARLKAEEQSVILNAEEVAQLAQMRLNDEIRNLRENLESAQKETEELRKAKEPRKQVKSRCNIM